MDRSAPAHRVGERVRVRGASWTVSEVERGVSCAALRLIEEASPPLSRTLLSPFDRFRRVLHPRAPAVVDERKWLERIRQLGAIVHPAGGLRAAAAANIRLLAYQLEPALAVVRRGASRLLIADEVGLGKTVQAGLIIAELARIIGGSFRAIVVVPAGLRDQWQHELRRLFALDCTIADSAWIASATADRPIDANPWSLPGIYVASHDFVKRPEVLRPVQEVAWHVFVMDEAHAASSFTDRRAAAHALACQSQHVILLTATPHFDDPAQHEALCTIGKPEGVDDPIYFFRHSRQDAGLTSSRRSRLLLVQPTEAERRMHHLLGEYTRRIWHEADRRGDALARLAAVVLRKRALSSAASLALSIRRRAELLVAATATAEQLLLPLAADDRVDDEEPLGAMAAPGLADATVERRWLAVIAEAAARAAADESKIRFLRQYMRRIREPVIVFTEYRDTLARLRSALADDSVLVLHGGLTPAERSRVQTAFNSKPAILLATDAAAEGLNLHGQCRAIVHYELPWSTGRLEQRAGRVDRLGQARRVHETALVAADTAERLVLGPLLHRAARVRSASRSVAGLASVLAESHVADVIFGGNLPELVPYRDGHHYPRAVEADLNQEARREAERLDECRTISRGPQTLSSGDRPLIACVSGRTAGLESGVVLVYHLRLSLRDRGSIHDEAIVLAWPEPPRGPGLDLSVRATSETTSSDVPSAANSLSGTSTFARDSSPYMRSF
jgi:superfamily II DNA or RNA helicase